MQIAWQRHDVSFSLFHSFSLSLLFCLSTFLCSLLLCPTTSLSLWLSSTSLAESQRESECTFLCIVANYSDSLSISVPSSLAPLPSPVLYASLSIHKVSPELNAFLLYENYLAHFALIAALINFHIVYIRSSWQLIAASCKDKPINIMRYIHYKICWRVCVGLFN